MDTVGRDSSSGALALALLDATPGALLAASGEGRILLWSRGAELLFGHSAEEAVGAPLDGVIAAPGHAAEVHAALADANRGGRARLTTVSRRGDGSSIAVDATLIRAGAPGDPFIAVVATPHNVEPPRVSEAQLRVVLDAVPDALVMVGPKGQIKLANAQVEPLFGYARDELIGQPVEVLIPESLRGQHAALRTSYAADPRTRPMGSHMELTDRRKDGTMFPVEISLAPIRTTEGI